jgi:uncharacterized protein YlxW (UPF0749 family)
MRALALAAIGFLLAVAYQQVVADEPSATRARADLVRDVRARQSQTDRLRERADRLRDDVAGARDRALAGNADADRLRDLAAGAGLGRVRGDGAAIRLADAPPVLDPVTGKQGAENPGLVLDRDVQDLVNALWQAGAEAVAVNDQRLTALSTIRAAGGVILVDFRPVTSPYTLAAIGPDELAESVRRSPTGRRFQRYAQTYRMEFSVRDRDDLTLPAAPDPPLRHARPPSPSVSPSVSPPSSSAPTPAPARPLSPSPSGGRR